MINERESTLKGEFDSGVSRDVLVGVRNALSEKKKAILVAFAVSIVLLVVAVAGTLVFDYYVESIEFDILGLMLGHTLGFLMIFVIVYKYEVKDIESQNEDNQNHNIY